MTFMALERHSSFCFWGPPCAVNLPGLFMHIAVSSLFRGTRALRCLWLPWRLSNSSLSDLHSSCWTLGLGYTLWGGGYIEVLVGRADGTINSCLSYENWWPVARMPCWYLWLVSMRNSGSQKMHCILFSKEKLKTGYFFPPFIFPTHNTSCITINSVGSNVFHLKNWIHSFFFSPPNCKGWTFIFLWALLFLLVTVAGISSLVSNDFSVLRKTDDLLDVRGHLKHFQLSIFNSCSFFDLFSFFLLFPLLQLACTFLSPTPSFLLFSLSHQHFCVSFACFGCIISPRPWEP